VLASGTDDALDRAKPILFDAIRVEERKLEPERPGEDA